MAPRAITCAKCEVRFGSRLTFDAHKDACEKGLFQKFSCSFCAASFSRKDGLSKHIKNRHNESVKEAYYCAFCKRGFVEAEEMLLHRLSHQQELTEGEFSLINHAHNRAAQVFRLVFPEDINFLDPAMIFLEKRLENFLKTALASYPNFKAVLVINIEFVQLSEIGEICNVITVPFRTNTERVFPSTDPYKLILEWFFKIDLSVDEFIHRGSGWTINDLLFADVEIMQTAPISGSCGMHEVFYKKVNKLPKLKGNDERSKLEREKEIKRTHGITFSWKGFAREGKVETPGKFNCFHWAVAAHFLPPQGKRKSVSNKELEEVIEKIGLKVEPGKSDVKLSEIKDFEKENSHLDLGISVLYRDEEGDVFPIHMSGNSLGKNHLVLLLTHTTCKIGEDEGEEETRPHYGLIKNPADMLAPRHRDKDWKRKVYFCFNCFNHQWRKSSYENHIAWCHKELGRQVIMPEPGSVTCYQDHKKEFKIGYVGFFDFETIQVTPEKSCNCSSEIIEAEKSRKNMSRDEEIENELNKMALEGLRSLGEEWEREILEMNGEERLLTTQKNQRAMKRNFYELCGKKKKSRFRIRTNPLEKIDGEIKPRIERDFCEEYEKLKKNVSSISKDFLIREKGCPHQTHVLTEHAAFSYTLILIDRTGKVVEDICYSGLDAVSHFMTALLDLEEKYVEFLKKGVSMNITEKDQRVIENACKCHICGEDLNSDRVLDHDHVSGKFKGVAHDLCNLQRKEVISIPIFAHNFSGYDSHLIVREMGKFKDRIFNLAAIPLNTQKFKMLNINHLVLLDSQAFLPGSLEKLTQTLVASRHGFPLLKQWMKNDEKRELLLRKGVYPYDFATSWEKLKSQTSLPDFEGFYNRLIDSGISRSDYEHATNVWKTFECKDMIEYTELYCRTDVYLIAEAIIDLREKIYREFGLDLSHFLSLPMLAKSIMLKSTQVEMELISDQEMSRLVRTNVRGGLAYINTRHMKRESGSDAPSEERSGESGDGRSLVYLDANNLYGKAMTYPLPLNGFRWMTDEEIKDFNTDEVSRFFIKVTLRVLRRCWCRYRRETQKYSYRCLRCNRMPRLLARFAE